jgi:hypothetical protein
MTCIIVCVPGMSGIILSLSVSFFQHVFDTY